MKGNIEEAINNNGVLHAKDKRKKIFKRLYLPKIPIFFILVSVVGIQLKSVIFTNGSSYEPCT